MCGVGILAAHPVYSYMKKFLPGTYLMHEILRYYTNRYIIVFMLRLAY